MTAPRPEPKLPDRFDVERVTEKSPLPTPARDVLYALARRMQQGSTYIPLQHATISLNKLAEISGWSKRQVQRALNYLEARAIITRRRPSLHDARTKQARTSYTVHYEQLEKLGTGSPKEARDTQAYGLGPPRRKPRDTQARELGTEGPEARDSVAPNQTLSDKPDQPDLETALIVSLLKVRTGQAVSDDQAAAIRQLLLARPGAEGEPPAAYIRRVLNTDPKPQRWLPNAQPPDNSQQEEAS